MHSDRTFAPVTVAVLTVSDTRTLENDLSGQLLESLIVTAGHQLMDRRLTRDDRYSIRAILSEWILREDIRVIITTGGTGVTGRDGTPEACQPLFDKTLEGFGETFRMLSYEEIGSSTLQSRATAGVANGTYIFCLPGSSGACRLAFETLIAPQIDIRTRPCNLAELIPRLREA